MPVIDITNKKFNKLLVLQRDESKKGGAAYWICKCDCGNIISTRGSNLRSGKKQDCGCGKKGINNINLDLNSLIGKTFGRLTVINRDLSKPIGHGYSSYWICQCECGNTVSVSHQQLTTGGTKSCGCLKSELLAKKNEKDLTNQKFGMVTAKENTYKLSQHHSYIWRCECDCGNTEYYVSAENLLSGKINSCGCNTRSLGEQRIEKILIDNNILFIPEYRFINSIISNKRYDFAIINENNDVIRLIEFDGEQHYKAKDNYFDGEQGFIKRQQNDNIKNQYALQNNIPLVRIPYTELNNLSLELIMGNTYLIS